jgi:membrane associated rhomboid family serine protease
MNETPGDSGAQTPEGDERPHDGALDFSSYSLSQLNDLRQLIDPATQPQNHANLLAAIARLAATASTPSAAEGRFSLRDGWRGWLDAKRRRSPVYGTGSLTIGDDHVTLHGHQRTWLGMKAPGAVQLALESIRNVATDGEWLHFESKRRLLPARHIRYRCASSAEARNFAARLPPMQSEGFAQRWEEIRAFHVRIDSLGGRPWPVLALMALNIAMFAAVAIANGGIGDFDPLLLVQWGANFGPATMNDQWWRLISAEFLHANLAHLAANMWVLFNIGRLACQLYGNLAFLGLYFGAGLCGFIASTAWNPGNVTVGASAAIFGVIGAFVAFMFRQRSQMPPRLLRAHWISTLVFIAFNLVSGALDPKIDNAGHVGGLLAGFVLGGLLARPIDPAVRARWPLWQSISGFAIVAGVALAGFFQVHGIKSSPNSIERFMRDNAWYVNGERENLTSWQQSAAQLGMGMVSSAEVSRRFDSQIMPFWKEAHQKLQAMNEARGTSVSAFEILLLEYVRLRRDWALAVADAADGHTQRAADASRLMQETDDIQAQIERLQMRANMEYRPRALAHSLFVNRLRAFVNPRGWQCVDSPDWAGRKLGDNDSTADAPMLHRELGCRAQRLFHEGDYQSLDAQMRAAAAKFDDLPDGTSTFGGIFGALSSLMYYGTYDLEGLLGRTADWRRAVKDPLMAELVEAMVFQQWAWTARGHGAAREISAQAWYHFRHRVQMAAAALRSVEAQGKGWPIWHDLSLDVALDLSDDVDEIRAIVDRGHAQFPEYLPLYTSMLRVLMPRWIGSYEKVEQFISDVTRADSADQDMALYAQLYWSYFLLGGRSKLDQP